jgi:DNA processing protein
MERRELEFYYAIYLSEGIGAQRLMKLYESFGSAEKIFRARDAELRRVEGIGATIAGTFCASRDEAYEHAKGDLDRLPSGAEVITFFDQEFPERLKHIYSPPALLFLQGNIELHSVEKNIAVVGTRKMSDYGRRVTEEICREFAASSVTVTSGFASGVDTAAHQSVFDAGGTTVAVLGSGLDVIYPPTNKGFAKKLLESGRGLIISELPLGASPDGKNFPWRNRIVSGLSSATIVIESAESGGSMITAAIALDQNKDVFALPGDINRSTSKGPNMLIRENRAKLFRTAEDILIDLGWKGSLAEKKHKQGKEDRKQDNLSIFESAVVEVLDQAGEPVHIDVIAERTGFDIGELLVHLLELELREVINQPGGKYFTTVF